MAINEKIFCNRDETFFADFQTLCLSVKEALMIYIRRDSQFTLFVY